MKQRRKNNNICYERKDKGILLWYLNTKDPVHLIGNFPRPENLKVRLRPIFCSLSYWGSVVIEEVSDPFPSSFPSGFVIDILTRHCNFTLVCP